MSEPLPYQPERLNGDGGLPARSGRFELLNLPNALVAFALLACAAALLVSVYPGVLNDLLFLAILLSIPVLGLIGLVAIPFVVILAVKARWRDVHIPWTRLMIVAALLAGTYVLLKFYVPRRIAFIASRSSFERMVAQSPPSQFSTTPRRFGVYRVDEIAADPRGGVYFRTHAGADGIGPDTMSYGFVHKPNSQGSPFGAAWYKVHHITGDWYWFKASDDWD